MKWHKAQSVSLNLRRKLNFTSSSSISSCSFFVFLILSSLACLFTLCSCAWSLFSRGHWLWPMVVDHLVTMMSQCYFEKLTCSSCYISDFDLDQYSNQMVVFVSTECRGRHNGDEQPVVRYKAYTNQLGYSETSSSCCQRKYVIISVIVFSYFLYISNKVHEPVSYFSHFTS